MIPQSLIDEILSKTKLSEIINEFVPLKKDGMDMVGLCPFHNEKSPSFKVSNNKDLYKCFGCGKSGNAITFLIEHKQLSYPAAVKYLADKANIYFSEEKREYKKPVWNNRTELSDKVIKWFESRKITQETVKYFKVTEGIESMPVKGGGFKEMNTIQFNYFRDEELINIKYRGPQKEFKLVSGAELIFFNLNAIKGTKRAIIVEGCPDCMTVHQCGFKEVVSVPNGASVSGKINLEYLDNCIEYFLDKEEIIIATDNDTVGRRLMEALAERLGKERCYKVVFKQYKDANECLVKEKEGTQAIIESFADKKEFPLNGVFSVDDHSDDVDDIYDHGLPKGSRTTMKNLNKLIEFHKGYLSVIHGIPSHGKALCLDTDIPTVNGWKKMRDITVFDQLYDENGNMCYVTNVTDIMYDRPCYKITFSDGTEIIADEEHKWLTDTWKSRRSASNKKNRDIRNKGRVINNNGKDQSYKREMASVKTTLEIFNTLRVKSDNRLNHSIPLTKPLKNKEKQLLIPPYTLGAWLGDGTSQGGGFTSADIEIIQNIRKDGFIVNKWNTDDYDWGILNLSPKLKKLNLIDNKHIPMQYLRASYKQRLALLQGLMDTDGHLEKSDKRCEFCNTNKELAYQVYELITSLGIRATVLEGDAFLYGRYISKKYRILFTTQLNVFKLKRKLKGLPKNRVISRRDCRYILNCEKIDSVPVKCIAVDSPSHLFLCTKSFIPTHNSSAVDQIALGLAINADWKGAFYSPENRPTSLHISNLCRKLTGKSWYGNDRMSKDEMKLAKSFLNDHFYFIKPEKDFSLDSILDAVKGLVLRKGIDFFVIDAFNKLEHKYQGANETKYISDTLDKLVAFLEYYNVHCFLVVHPTKQLKQKNSQKFEVPNLYSLAGSAAFYNKADVGICIYRDFDEDLSRWYVQKVKFQHWGETGYCDFKYDLVSSRFNEFYGGAHLGSFDRAPWIHSIKNEQPKQETGIIINNEETPF